MILENNKREFQQEGGGQSTRMSISAEVESHIVKVLTESYSDALGSAIRECVSNAVDSHTEAGVTDPIIVSIKRDMSQRYVLSIEDVGLGLDEAGFNKYIMGLGESTKRQNANLLGGYGMGCKAWLAYTENFNYTIRKDGVERKYLIYKGEEFPEAQKISENPTKERNGVKVSVTLKNGWNEISICKQKIKEQLSYLDNIWYDIEGFKNAYTIHRAEHLQVSDIRDGGSMHIALKNIAYPIDWSKLNMAQISLPIALRFDTYDELMPIFNREAITWNRHSVEAVKKKIELVNQWLVEEWNKDNNKQFNTLAEAWETLNQGGTVLTRFGRQFDLSYIKDAKFERATVKGISIRKPAYYMQKEVHLFKEWRSAGKTSTNKFHKEAEMHWVWRDILKGGSNYKVPIVVNYTIAGNIRSYMMEKYPDRHFIRKKDEPMKLRGGWQYSYYYELDLKNVKKDKWRENIKEWQSVVKSYEDKFEYLLDIEDTKDYKDWLADRRARIKAGQIRDSSVYVALNKEKGDITVYTGRSPLRQASDQDSMVFDKGKMKIEDIPFKGLHVYCTDTMPSAWIKGFPTVRFWKINPTEKRHITTNNFLTKEQFMKSKPFERLTTSLLIKSILDKEPSYLQQAISYSGHLKTLREKIIKYKDRNPNNLYDVNDIVKILEYANEENVWDQSIYADVISYQTELNKFRFLSAFKSGYALTEDDKKLIKNITYIMLKNQKVVGTFVDDMILTAPPPPPPVVVPAPEDGIVGEPDAIIEEEIEEECA